MTKVLCCIAKRKPAGIDPTTLKRLILRTVIVTWWVNSCHSL